MLSRCYGAREPSMPVEVIAQQKVALVLLHMRAIINIQYNEFSFNHDKPASIINSVRQSETRLQFPSR